MSLDGRGTSIRAELFVRGHVRGGTRAELWLERPCPWDATYTSDSPPWCNGLTRVGFYLEYNLVCVDVIILTFEVLARLLAQSALDLYVG